jgi:drug/metabolite transporter (DMT)-like permease
MDWKILAISVPLLFVSYQALSKLLPKTISIFLVNAYASLIGLVVMLVLHFLLSPNKSLALNPKYLPIVIGIGLLISLGNFGIIKAYNLGAPQSLFSPLFYIALIIYGTLFGLLLWHEHLNLPQILGTILSIIGIIMIVYFKK